MNVAGFGKNAHKGLLACFENVNLVRRFAAILRHSPLAQNQKKNPGFLTIHEIDLLIFIRNFLTNFLFANLLLQLFSIEQEITMLKKTPSTTTHNTYSAKWRSENQEKGVLYALYYAWI